MNKGHAFGMWLALILSASAFGGMIYQGVKGPKAVRDFNESIRLDTERTKALTEQSKLDIQKIDALNRATTALTQLAETMAADAQVQELKRVLNEYNRSLKNAK